jgi:cytochrome c-type biogenesis protein CcmH
MGPLNMCTMIECRSSVPMRAELKQMISEGKSDEAITDAFVEKYGTIVLSAPTTSGFNLTAWVMPFAVLATGFVLIAFVVRSWRSRTPVAASGPIDVKYQSRVEEELEKYKPED